MGFSATPGSVVDDTTINSMGFAGDSVDVSKPPGTIRILTLGGSAMFNRRMAERLRDRLKTATGRRLEVVGGALRAHTTMSSVLKYKVLRKYAFDIVLIYHGINDLWANHVALDEFREDYSHLGPWYKRNVWLDQCVVCRLVYNKWIYPGPTPHSGENRSRFASEHTFKRNLMVLIQSIRWDDSIPILMTFAWNIPKDYTYDSFQKHSVGYNNRENYDRWPVELWGSPQYVSEGLVRHNRIVRQLADIENVLLIDQEERMGKDLRWYGDVCHFSEEGTAKFVENITEFITEKRLLDQN